MRRAFTAPTSDCRCQWTISLRAKVANLGADDVAQCMRRKTVGDYCMQHAKMICDRFMLERQAARKAEFDCPDCGGNDDTPIDHCTDCER